MLQEWLNAEGFEQLDSFLTSAAIGLLMGGERERRQAAKAGLRTFTLIALLGASLALVAQRTGVPWLPAVGLVMTGAMMIAVYLAAPIPDDPGTTTIVAALLCFSLSVMTVAGDPQLALMTAIGATVLMYFKSELRGLTLQLDRTELISILQFAVLSFVILPLLPDRNMGPYDAINPRQIWLMVVLISGVSLAGYLALRFVGQRHGTWLLGLFGGLVSSTATTLAYARHARDSDEAVRISAPVIAIANIVVLARLALVIAVVAPEIWIDVVPGLAAGFVLGGIGVALLWRRYDTSDAAPMPAVRNPAAMKVSIVFGLLYGGVLLAAAWLRDLAGPSGLYAVALVSGLTDVDAITLSSLRLHDLGQVTAGMVAITVAIAVLSNNAFKLGMAALSGGRALALRCAGPMGAAMAGLVLGLFLPRFV